MDFYVVCVIDIPIFVINSLAYARWAFPTGEIKRHILLTPKNGADIENWNWFKLVMCCLLIDSSILSMFDRAYRLSVMLSNRTSEMMIENWIFFGTVSSRLDVNKPILMFNEFAFSLIIHIEWNRLCAIRTWWHRESMWKGKANADVALTFFAKSSIRFFFYRANKMCIKYRGIVKQKCQVIISSTTFFSSSHTVV